MTLRRSTTIYTPPAAYTKPDMDLPGPPKSPCLRVFDIPELSRLIVHGIHTTKDRASLLRVCRQFFENICPIVWSFILDPNALILLIPKSGIEPRDGLCEPKSIRKITSFPETFELSRFNLYAPHIQTLWLPALFQADDNNHWNEFLTHARTLNLLPNLKQITVLPNAPGQQLGQESINFLAAFLSPSISRFDILSRHQEYIGFEYFQSLLEILVERCPKVESLSAYPGQQNVTKRATLDEVDMTNFNVETLIEAIDLYVSRLPEISFSNPCVGTNYLLSRFTCLRSITTTCFILEHESFIVLSQLPKLEALSTLCGSYNSPQIYGTNLELPPSAFPALKSVHLTGALCSTAINLCGLEAFLNTLQILHLSCRTSQDLNVAPEPVNMADLITPITSFGLSITRLTLIRSGPWVIPPEIVQSLKRLPLVNLHLGDIDFDTFDVEGLICALPRLEELRLPSSRRSFPIKQLRTIAISLPALRHLSLFIRFDSVPELTHEDLQPLGLKTSPTMYFESDFYPRWRQPALSQWIAAFLYALWPNVTCVQAGDISLSCSFSEHFESRIFWEDLAPGEQEAGISNLETITRALDELRALSKGT